MLKAIEKYERFTIQQPKKKGIKPGLQLVLMDNVHFSNKFIR